MTDYDDKEDSIDEGSPYELYEFIGTYRSYYLTTDSLPRVHEGRTYIPVSGMSRSEITVGTHEDSSTDMTVVIPITEQIVKDYAFQITPPKLELILRRFHRGALTEKVYWQGPIVSMVVADEEATLRIPSQFNSILQGNIPSVFIQPPCNHVLFDEMCGVSRTDNAVDTTVSSVSGTTIMIASAGGFPDGFFVGGEIVVPTRNERRMIIAHGGTTITVNYGFGRLVPGESVQVAGGCDYSRGPNGCAKYSNLPRFGGCPYVPGESNNPFTQGID